MAGGPQPASRSGRNPPAARFVPPSSGFYVRVGISFLPVAHEGCTQSSRAGAEAIVKLVAELQSRSVRGGKETPLALKNILIVAPYNLQVNLLKQLLPRELRSARSIKFQGQQAPVVIVSMTTSRGIEAPRGTEFLFNLNCCKVGISCAQCLALVVHGAALLEGAWTKSDDLRRLKRRARDRNAPFCREHSTCSVMRELANF